MDVLVFTNAIWQCLPFTQITDLFIKLSGRFSFQLLVVTIKRHGDNG